MQYGGARKYCEHLVGSFTWLPFPFLPLIILVRVGNSVTFNNVTKKIAVAGTFHAAELRAGVHPGSGAAHGISQSRQLDAIEESPILWCCSGLINYLGKANSAFTVLLSSWFPPASLCFASRCCPSWAQGPSVQLSVCAGNFSSSKDYANSNWITELLSTLSDPGRAIPC